MSQKEKNFDAAAPDDISIAPFCAFVGTGLAFLVAVALTAGGLMSLWWMALWTAVFLGCWYWARRTRTGYEARRDEQVRERCARDSDWCDGRVCAERGIACPNADPEPRR